MRPRQFSFAWRCLFGASLTCSGLSEAAPAEGSLVVEVCACRGIEVEQVQHLLRVELKGSLARVPSAEPTHVGVTCARGICDVVVSEPDRAPRARSLRLQDVQGDVGARVLALAIAELLRDEELRRSVLPEREVEESIELDPESELSNELVHLSAGAGLNLVGEAQALFGPNLSVDVLAFRPLALRFGGSFVGMSEAQALGEAEARIVSLSALIGLGRSFGAFDLSGLVGYRLGTARVAGRGSAPDVMEGVVSGPWGGPLLTGVARLDLFEDSASTWALTLALGLEAGLVSFPVTGQVEPGQDIPLSDYWLGTNLSLGLRL